jgi:hypothetical protein
MGFAVKRCTCGEKRFEKVAPVQARQMELFVM